MLALVAISASGITGLAPEKAEAQSDNSIVVLMYHRFGESRYPTTNVRLAQLDAHISELTSGKYNILPLSEIVTALNAGETLPDRTIGITVDDAFLSVYKEAWPRFKKAGLPFTVFVATDNVADTDGSDYMTWDQIREMKAAGVEFQAHSLSHSHLPALDRDAGAREVGESIAVLERNLGQRPTLFAYPYGEASLFLMERAREYGMKAAFGQQSGAITAAHNRYYLPRFAINERYGEMDRFKQVVNSLGLAATDVLPFDPHLGQIEGDNPPAMGFTMPSNIKRGRELACYPSAGPDSLKSIARLGPYRVELRFTDPFKPGRTRVNCTVPGPDGRWRWFGTLYYVPKS